MSAEQRGWIDTGQVALRYAVQGDGPQTLLLMHEMGGSLESWDDIVPLLLPQFRVLRYDMRGAGLSEHPPAPFTIEMLAADASALLDALAIADPVVVLGCAVGGAVALQFASAYTARTRAVIATSPAVGVPAERRPVLLTRAEHVERTGSRPSIDASLDRGYPASLRGDTARFERTRGQRLCTNRAGFAATMRMLAALDMQRSLRSMARPTLIIAGEHDGDRPPDGVAETAASIPGARLHVLPSGHFMAIQTPELVVREVTQFLQGI